MSELLSESAKAPRTRQFLINKIAELIGGRKRCAALANISEDTLENACNRRDLTVEAMIDFIQSAGRVRGNYDLDRHVEELAAWFTPPRRRMVGEEVIQLGKVFFDALQNGGYLKASPASCPECQAPLKNIGWIEGKPLYTCIKCHREE